MTPEVLNDFHRHYFHSLIWQSTTWLGVPAQKCPLDLWIYQEIMNEVKPDLVVECGTRYGGSALFLATMCEIIGQGEVISVDIDALPARPSHRRLSYVHGSSVDSATLKRIETIRGYRKDCRTLVILDSDHSKAHVLQEMELYAPMISVGSYLIVEDTNLHGHPVLPEFGPGPMEAVAEFLPKNPDFVVDRSREKFFMTFNPGGYLKRKPKGA